MHRGSTNATSVFMITVVNVDYDYDGLITTLIILSLRIQEKLRKAGNKQFTTSLPQICFRTNLAKIERTTIATTFNQSY